LFADPTDGSPAEGVPRDLLASVPLPERLVELHELSRALDADRKQTGLFYTPAWLAAHLVQRLAEAGDGTGVPSRAPETIEDPACGGGAFLVAALRHRLASVVDGEQRRELAMRTMRGTDTDAAAITIARTVLSLVATEGSERSPRALLFPDLRVADPLREGTLATTDWVVGNPPFLDAKSRARLDRETGPRLRARFPDLRGAFDLFVPFVLRSLELLRPGGRLGLIVPDRLLTATYAASARTALVEQSTLIELLDLDPLGAFPDAAVFPLFLASRRAVPSATSEVRRGRLLPGLIASDEGAVRQTSLLIGGRERESERESESEATTATRDAPAPESGRETRPLETWFSVHAGTVGFEAATMSKALYDMTTAREGHPPVDASIPFAVTGSVDRYRLTSAPVRFLKRTYRAPRLPLATPLPPGRWALYHAPKIVVAGLARRLEATWVESPLALGVAAYALVPRAAVSRTETLAYLSIVNSGWLSELYRSRHGHRRLSGDYLTFHRRELAALPLPTLSMEEQVALAELATERLAPDADQADRAADLDKKIDEMVQRIVAGPLPPAGTSA
jgi:hypothetical protein